MELRRGSKDPLGHRRELVLVDLQCMENGLKRGIQLNCAICLAETVELDVEGQKLQCGLFTELALGIQPHRSTQLFEGGDGGLILCTQGRGRKGGGRDRVVGNTLLLTEAQQR